MRRYHDTVATFRPPPEAVWMYRGEMGEGHIICHNDASPHNFVHRDGEVRAFIDWDLAGPGDPRRDLAVLAWQTVPLYHPALCERVGWTAPPVADDMTATLAFVTAHADRLQRAIT